MHESEQQRSPLSEDGLPDGRWPVVDYFVPSAQRQARSELSRMRLLVLICLVGSVTSLLVQPLRLSMVPQHWVPVTSWAVATALLLVAPWVLKFTHNRALAGTLCCAGGWVGAVGVSVTEGGLASPNAVILIAMVVPAITFAGRHAGPVMCMLGILGTGLLFVAPDGRWSVPGPVLEGPALDFIRGLLNCVVIVGLGLVAWMYENERSTAERNLQDKATQLTLARDAALRAANTKSAFLANMSHEIRTPLNGVIGMTDLMLHSDLSPGDRRSLETIRTSGQALLEVVNDVLDVSKLDAGRMTLESEPFSVRDCAEDVLALFGHAALSKGVELNLRLSAGVPVWVVGDVVRMRQVLTNLVGNAVKFTERGQVTIHVGVEHGDRIRFAVQDTGIGIAESQQRRLFEAFAQEDASTTRRYGGTGLGLTISQRIVHLMGGELTVESELYVGSVFQFSVRLPPSEAQSLELPPALHGRRVLLVEPHPITAQVGRQLLESAGCEVFVAHGVSDANDLLENGRRMHVLVVSESTPHLRLLEETFVRVAERVPRVLVRTPAQAEEHPMAQSRDYLVDVLKPLRQDVLWQAVEACLVPATPNRSGIPAALDESLGKRRPMRILVVEDNPINQRVMAAMLRRLGYAPTLTSSGADALAELARGPFDLVLLDMHMPGMDGTELARAIREASSPVQLPHLVAVTASVLPEQCESYRRAGIEGLLAKPVQATALRQVLEQVADDIEDERTRAV